jgi:dTDP-4-dehydrorhamnose 3,5-epimerase
MTSRLTIGPTSLDGMMLIQRKPMVDERGLFERLFCVDELAAQNIQMRILQANLTLTVREGAVRGMHFQHPPHAETKIVSCLAGRVFDVAIDLRHGSPTFLHWHAEELSAENHKSLLIPAGFAHGFQTLTPDCQLLYFHDKAYAPEAEGGISPVDPAIAISWPLPIAEMSPRDRNQPALPSDFKGMRP